MVNNFLPKVSIIGAGNVGSTCAFLLAANSVADVFLFDKAENLAKAKALDIGQAAVGMDSESQVIAAQKPEELKDSRVVIITAGIARKPGMSRQDLTQTNAAIAKEIAQNIKNYAQGAIVVVVTNPVDILTYLVLKETGFNRRQVMGMAGIVDNSRLRYFAAQKTRADAARIGSHVLGLHADQMVMPLEHLLVNNQPISTISKESEIEQIKDNTRNAGAQIVGLLGNGSAYYMPGTGAYLMARAVLEDAGQLFDACFYLEGEYGLHDVCLGVPAKIGKVGIKEVREVEISSESHEQLKENARLFNEQLQLL